MAGENPQMESFLQNAGDAEAQQAAEDVNAEEMVAAATVEQAEAKPDEQAETGGQAEEKPDEKTGERAEATETKEDDDKGAGQEAEDKDGKTDERPPNYVPIQALDEARGHTRDTQELLREAQGTINTMNQRFSEFVTHVRGGEQPGGEKQDDKTSLDDDPVQNLDGRLGKLESLATNFGQQQQMNTQLQAANNQIQAAEAQFAATTPDYGAAVLHVQNLFVKDLQMRGVDPMTAVNQVRQEMGMAALQVLVAGQDPAAVLYDRAKAFGYRPANGEEQDDTPKEQAAELKTVEQVSTLEQQAAKLKTIAQGQEANRSLSDGGGRSSGQPETLEDLAACSDAEIDKYWDYVIKRGEGVTFGGLLR